MAASHVNVESRRIFAQVVADLDGYCAATFPLVWSLVLFGIILEVALRCVSPWVYSGRASFIVSEILLHLSSSIEFVRIV